MQYQGITLTFTDLYRLNKTRIGGLSHSSTTDSLFHCYTNKTEQHLQTYLIVTYWGLDKISTVAYYLGETAQTYNYNYFFNPAVGSVNSGEILASVWQEEENFEALKRCYIQIYPTSALLCYEKKLLFYSTYVKLTVE